MKTTIIILGILMISVASAFYAGETISVENEMGIENLVYTIIDNSTIVPTLNITINKDNITIKFPNDMTPDSFKIVFIEEQTKEVVQTVYRSGRGSKTKYIDRNVTVVQPLFLDRNITVEKEIILDKEEEIIEAIETIEEKQSIKHLYLIILFILWILVLIILFIIYTERIRKERIELDNLLLNSETKTF